MSDDLALVSPQRPTDDDRLAAITKGPYERLWMPVYTDIADLVKSRLSTSPGWRNSEPLPGPSPWIPAGTGYATGETRLDFSVSEGA